MEEIKDYNMALKLKIETLLDSMVTDCIDELVKNKMADLVLVFKKIEDLSDVAGNEEFLLKKKELGKALIKITYPELKNITMRFWTRLFSILKTTNCISNMTEMWLFLFVLGTIERTCIDNLSPFSIGYDVCKNKVKLTLNCDILTNQTMKELHEKLSVIDTEIKNLETKVEIKYIINYCSEETILDLWQEEEFKNMNTKFVQIN